MTKTYNVVGGAPSFYVERDGVTVGGPYTVRTNATRRIRLLKEADAKPAPEPLPDPVAMAAPSTDGGTPEPDGVGIDSPNAYERHQARARYGLAKADYAPTERRILAHAGAELMGYCAKDAAASLAQLAASAPVINRHCVGVFPYARKRDYRMTPARHR